MIEQYHDPANARSLFAAARAQAADAGNMEIELRALYDDAEVGERSSATWRPPAPPSTKAPSWPSGAVSAGPGSGSPCSRGQLAVRYLDR